MKNPLVDNETFMILGDNDPFGDTQTLNWNVLPQKDQIIQSLLPRFMEGEPRLNIQTEGIFYSLLSAYMSDKTNDKKTDLLARKFDNGRPNLLNALIDDIYIKSSEEQFHSFIRDLYTELTKSGGIYEQTRDQLLIFVKSRAGMKL